MNEGAVNLQRVVTSLHYVIMRGAVKERCLTPPQMSYAWKAVITPIVRQRWDSRPGGLAKHLTPATAH
jgi:hypothetical protein